MAESSHGAPQVRVILWTIPRSLGTVFTKCLSNVDGAQIIKEPYAAAHWCGPDKLSFTDDTEFHQQLKASTTASPKTNTFEDSICTYNWVKETLEADYSEKSFIFCHDQAYCLGQRYQDLPCDYKHTFLIRHPHKQLPSWKNLLVKCMPSYLHKPFGDLPMLPAKCGFGELYDLMETLRNRGGEYHPIIIDADDLQQNPESILKQYLHLLGVPFKQSLLEWNPGGEEMQSWIISNSFYEDAETCGWFNVALESQKFGPPCDIPTRDELDADLLPLVDVAMPYYDVLFSMRIRP